MSYSMNNSFDFFCEKGIKRCSKPEQIEGTRNLLSRAVMCYSAIHFYRNYGEFLKELRKWFLGYYTVVGFGGWIYLFETREITDENRSSPHAVKCRACHGIYTNIVGYLKHFKTACIFVDPAEYFNEYRKEFDAFVRGKLQDGEDYPGALRCASSKDN